jgi:hypothetical protein
LGSQSQPAQLSTQDVDPRDIWEKGMEINDDISSHEWSKLTDKAALKVLEQLCGFAYANGSDGQNLGAYLADISTAETGTARNGYDRQVLKYWADKTGKDFCEYTAGLVEAATDSPKAVLEFGKDQFMGSAKSTIYGWLHMSTIGNEVENMRSTLYWRAIEAEKKGYHVNWDKFPFDEDLPDPRKKQDDDQPQPTDQPKKPSEMTPEEFDDAVKRAEEIVRQIEEEQRRKAMEPVQSSLPFPESDTDDAPPY